MRDLLTISQELSRKVHDMEFGGAVHTVYNPLEYAFGPHANYLRRYGHMTAGDGPLKTPPKGRWLMIGMNPGPFGMAQTGVPFGEIGLVRDWMRIEGEVHQPPLVHPNRPITGFETTRSEVSGQRLWGWARDRFETPERFFSKFWVHNTIPLVFMSETGSNITPDKLSKAEREPLFEAADWGLRATADLIEPAGVIAIGAFAERRAKAAFKKHKLPIVRILHPSPASPKANRGWAEQAEAEMRAGGLLLDEILTDLC